MTDINGLGQSGVEGSVIGNDATPVNSAVNRNRAMSEARAAGEAMGDGLVSKIKAALSSIAGAASGRQDQTGGASSSTGTSFVGNVLTNMVDTSNEIREEGSMIGKTRMVASRVSAIRAAGAGGGGAGGAGTAIKGGAMAGGVALGATMAIGATRMAITAANNRFESGRADVLAKDQMSVLYQQMTGLDQLGVSSKYRMPLTKYRLGAGGDLALMQMEAQTGIGAVQQGASVEAFRTMSGYQMSAGEAAGQIANLANPATVNRMYMMTGTSIIGPGGTQRSAMSVIQNLVKQTGLTNEGALKDALQQGSVTRTRLRNMGVPEDMITQVIQYAKQNLTYRDKGGKGMYDPSSEQQRRKMGIEENFATQVEETQRLENKRGEDFYRRQVDNYADLERQTQSLTRIFGALEDQLSGILGGLGSNRIATSVFQSITSPLGGDPAGATSDATTSVPSHGGSGRKSLNEIKNMSSFREMHPKMQERLLSMMRDNPNVGFGQGVRSSQSQRAMFMQRYRKTDKETNAQGKKNWYWDGSYWEHVSGAPAAPPGRSMHEIGLAADLVGDTDWVVKNAHKYGLKHFKGVNNEPWHVQPAELPNGRKAYEEGGAKWGGTTAGAAPYEPDSDFGDSLDGRTTTGHGGSSDNGSTFGNAEPYGLSISQKVSRSITGPSSGQTGGESGGGSSGTKVNKKRVDPSLIRRGQLTGEQVALLLHKAGFRGEDIIKGVAISERESRWKSTAHNPNRSTGDNSYGLFQINMIEKYAEGRRKSFGIASNDALFDPETNVRAAKQMYDGRKSRGNGWYDWGPYKGEKETYNTDVSKATRIVNSVDFGGDPMGSASTSRPASGSDSVSVVGGATFNISPTINMSGGSGGDLQRIAREVAILVKREIELELMRSV